MALLVGDGAPAAPVARRRRIMAAAAAPTARVKIAAARPAERVRPAPGALTGWFGEVRGRHVHPGMDIDGETGDPVVAAAAGRVMHAGAPLRGYEGYGNIIVINHPEGSQTLYGHLSSVAVHEGDLVSAGQLIGAIGSTGWSTGSHLHFEVRRGGVAIDPAPWLATVVAN
ncbi:MAG: murein hydrolase activator EnvC [Mycobacteriales bacterium]